MFKISYVASLYAMLVAFVVVAYLSIGSCDHRVSAPTATAGDSATKTLFLEHMTTVRQWALLCNDDIAKDAIGVPTPPLICDDGDDLAFNGMLCASGSGWACSRAKASFDGQRFWRSPARIGIQDQGMPTFSRDMFLGALLYLAATKDEITFDAYSAWLEAQPGGNMCLDRCVRTPFVDNLLAHVGDWIKMGKVSKWKQAVDWGLDQALSVQVWQVPPNYQLELIAEELWIRRMVGSWTPELNKVAEALLKRQPRNPMFHYVAHGVSQEMIDLSWELVPKERPVLRRNWAFADDFNPENGDDYGHYDPSQSMVWDWIMIELLIQRGY
jgi:hypothetical protein